MSKANVKGGDGNYVVVEADDLERLASVVQMMMARGYKPIGSLAIRDDGPGASFWYLQPMTLRPNRRPILAHPPARRETSR